MKRYITKGLQKNTLRLVSGGQEKSGNVLSPFGPLKVGLITMPKTKKEVPLTELLNYLEKGIADLSIKSYGVLNTYLNDTIRRVERTSSIYETTITRL